ncbi:GNAT family N-acetyltransferase [Pedobacter hartonius]|uniref:Ribosomal protein S18 acetylase RimI n=1 Tax=Pedobacter hartonius TaxID=425514 RepID=A0A1H4GBP8_9SPHI|nr:GNAT family N-acetyltransferase [Pedobacter hartonius]SEB06711.1 Ribosomal protein S18 acetylase RimI [Pedobacter hartonius]
MPDQEIKIINAVGDDVSEIYELYENAISFQKENNFPVWKGYNPELIDQEINDLLLYKIVVNEKLAGIFSAGPAGLLETELWKERTAIKSLYLSRIIVSRKYQGQRLFACILDWINKDLKKHRYEFIRLDTWADNPHLVKYYGSFGFKDLGIVRTSDSLSLPLQYRGLDLLIMEKAVAV